MLEKSSLCIVKESLSWINWFLGRDIRYHPRSKWAGTHGIRTKSLPDEIPSAHFCIGGRYPSHGFCNMDIIPLALFTRWTKSLLWIFQLGQNPSRLKSPSSLQADQSYLLFSAFSSIAGKESICANNLLKGPISCTEHFLYTTASSSSETLIRLHRHNSWDIRYPWSKQWCAWSFGCAVRSESLLRTHKQVGSAKLWINFYNYIVVGFSFA